MASTQKTKVEPQTVDAFLDGVTPPNGRPRRAVWCRSSAR
jgi:hypothetical protein